MKQIEVVAAIIYDDEGRIFATQQRSIKMVAFQQELSEKMSPNVSLKANSMYEQQPSQLCQSTWHKLTQGPIVQNSKTL